MNGINDTAKYEIGIHDTADVSIILLLMTCMDYLIYGLIFSRKGGQ